MNAKSRENLRQEALKRLEEIVRTMPPAMAYAPWLHPKLTYAEVRRTVHRLRTGAIRNLDPTVPDALLADLLEGAIEKDRYVRTTEGLRRVPRRRLRSSDAGASRSSAAGRPACMSRGAASTVCLLPSAV